MVEVSGPRPHAHHTPWIIGVLTSSVFIVFVSSNIVNVGNLAFNILFSRWMGPEIYGDLALVLTIKLAVLGVMGAVQMSTSQIFATEDADRLRPSLGKLNGWLFLTLWICLPIIFAILFLSDAGNRLGLLSPHVLYLLLLSVPFSAPLSILRGYAFGRGFTWRIVTSANIEMAVRLVGSIIVWKLGLGLDAVVLAIVASIIAGWAVLADLLPIGKLPEVELEKVRNTIGIAAFPFAVLQVSQVVSLDGEIFVTSAALSGHETGLIAALSLFQRIEFFACFALASVLLPRVIRSSGSMSEVYNSAAPVFLLYFMVILPTIAASFLAPELMISLMVGVDFMGASEGLVLASLSAAAFTLSYLLATFLAALKDMRGIWMVATTAALQLLTMSAAAVTAEPDILTLLKIKVAFQGALVLRLLFFSAWVLRSRAVGIAPQANR